jgi:hypothetical protein
MCYWTPHKHILLNNSQTHDTEQLRNIVSGKTHEQYSLLLSMSYVITAVGPPLNSGISVDLKVILMHFENRRCKKILFCTSQENKCVLLSRKYGILHLKSNCETNQGCLKSMTVQFPSVMLELWSVNISQYKKIADGLHTVVINKLTLSCLNWMTL